jgi:hypothetical protein
MGMWKHEEGTPGFFWKVMYQPSRDAAGDGKGYSCCFLKIEELYTLYIDIYTLKTPLKNSELI